MMKPLIPFTMLAISRLVHSADGIQSVGAINFVVTVNERDEYSFPMPPTATLVDLHKTIALGCGIKYPFEIQLLGETIVSFRPINQIISENPNISSMWRMLSAKWGITSGFRIPLRVHLIKPMNDETVDITVSDDDECPTLLDEDTEVYLCLLQMFGKALGRSCQE